LSANANSAPAAHTVYVSLGSNITPRQNLPRAIELLRAHSPIQACSTVWETPPVGTGGPKFHNADVCLTSPLGVDELKFQVLRAIETRLGRVRSTDKYAARPIDLDILIYDGQLIDPEIWEQPHLAIPLAEIYPDYQNTHTGETIAAAARTFQARVQFKPVRAAFKTQNPES
jgi:2-amino-4-hydroxy-6-hydroxymethyldihydropteridine diphosphokinase